MVRGLNLRKNILLGLFLVSPIITFASSSKGFESNLRPDFSKQSVKTKSEDNDVQIDNLLKEGAISTKEADILKKDKTEKSSFGNDFTSDDKEKQIKNQVKVKFNETKKRIKLTFLDLNDIVRTSINRIDSGWQIIFETTNKQNIELDRPYTPFKYISEVNIDKFNSKLHVLNIQENNYYKAMKPILKNSSPFEIDIKLNEIRRSKMNNFDFPIFNIFNRKKIRANNKDVAIAPPLGDIATGSVVLQNRGYILNRFLSTNYAYRMSYISKARLTSQLSIKCFS